MKQRFEKLKHALDNFCLDFQIISLLAFAFDISQVLVNSRSFEILRWGWYDGRLWFRRSRCCCLRHGSMNSDRHFSLADRWFESNSEFWNKKGRDEMTQEHNAENIHMNTAAGWCFNNNCRIDITKNNLKHKNHKLQNGITNTGRQHHLAHLVD